MGAKRSGELGTGASRLKALASFALFAWGTSLSGGLCTSCAAPRVNLTRGPREYVAGDYRPVLDRWTRDARLPAAAELGDLLYATATYESWDFRWAYTIRYADDLGLTVNERHQLLVAKLTETTESHHFYVALHSSRYKWTDLTREPPAWIIRLVDDRGHETPPSAIELIAKPGPAEFTYFPYTTPWRTVHRIQFPVRTSDGRETIAPDALWFGLKFSGPRGRQLLVWRIEPASNASASQELDQRGDTRQQFVSHLALSE